MPAWEVAIISCPVFQLAWARGLETNEEIGVHHGMGQNGYATALCYRFPQCSTHILSTTSMPLKLLWNLPKMMFPDETRRQRWTEGQEGGVMPGMLPMCWKPWTSPLP